MASKINFSQFLLLFLAHYALVNGDTTLIKSTCKNTKYYNLCVSSLKSDPSSPNADPKGLAVIMAGIGMTNATSTSSYLSYKLLVTMHSKGILIWFILQSFENKV